MHVRRALKSGAQLLAAAGLLCSVSLFSAQASSAPSLETLGSYIDGTIESQMVLEDIPAVTVSVVKDGQLLFSKGYGFADLEKRIPVNAEKSLFRIGSTSKLFTWTAVMQMVEAGKLDLDADVNSYLDFKIPATYAQPITLKHILSHTAGFEDGGLGYLIQYFPDHGPELAEAMEQYIPLRVNAPGEVTSYSNYATALAGLIVQNVSGKPFNQYVKEHIFDPLGMTYATFEEPLPQHLAEHMVKGYAREAGKFDEKPYEMINSFGPAGAVAASAEDMAKFMQAHLNLGELNGQRILQEETARQMHSVIFAGDKRLQGMAHGFYEHNFNGHRLIGHGGDTMQFHTDMMIDVEQNLGIFVSYMNTVSNKARNGFVRQIYDHYFPQEVAPLTPPADFAGRAAKYAGTYTFWRRNFSSIEKAFGLMGGTVDIIPTEDNTLIVTGPFAVRQYVEVGENLFRQLDGPERIAFVSRTGDGIDTFYFDSLPFMSLQKLPWFEGALFKIWLPVLSLLLFLQVILSWFYKRQQYKSWSAADKRLVYSSLGMSLFNLLFVILAVVIVVSYQDTLYSKIPFALKASLVVPFIALFFTALSLWSWLKRQRAGQASLGSQIYYAVVILSGVYMVLFYNYWNLLGWKFHG